MKKAWKHIVTGIIVSDEEYSMLGILAKTNFVPLILKNNDTIIRK